MHVVVPLHAGGCNASWNLISLSLADHQIAHERLYRVYGLKQDLCALNFRKGHTSEGYALRASLGHAAQKKQRLGFFNPSQQHKRGLKGGKRQTPKKIRAYTQKLHHTWPNVLSSTTVWFYKPTGFKLVTPTVSCTLPRDVTDQGLHYDPFKCVYKAKVQSLTSALTRVVKGQRQQACGWWLLGSLTDTETKH